MTQPDLNTPRSHMTEPTNPMRETTMNDRGALVTHAKKAAHAARTSTDTQGALRCSVCADFIVDEVWEEAVVLASDRTVILDGPVLVHEPCRLFVRFPSDYRIGIDAVAVWRRYPVPQGQSQR
jgi:hypothetical protein